MLKEESAVLCYLHHTYVCNLHHAAEIIYWLNVHLDLHNTLELAKLE